MNHVPCPRCQGSSKDPDKTGDTFLDAGCELCNGSGYLAKGSMLQTVVAAKVPKIVKYGAAFSVAYLTTAQAYEGEAAPLGAKFIPVSLAAAPASGTSITITGLSGGGYVYTQPMPNMMADEPIRLDPATPVWWGKVTLNKG
jgi:hypothetical protein